MKVTFPAMRGRIGGRTYYSTMMKLNVIPKMFTFRDWIEFTPEDREQRVLNKKRIPTIAKYIVDNDDGYLFSAITASYKCDVEFKPLNSSEMGTLEMEFEDANFVINDGQHRCAAIANAVKANPALGDESLSVLLFPYENRERVQQMFSDLNRFVAKTSKSLDILYDKRDELSIVTLDMCELVDVFNGTVDKDAVSLPVRSPKLFSLAAIYDANKELLRPVTERAHHSRDELVELAVDYWSAVAEVMPDWRKVKRGDLKSVELRQENISSHTVVLRALGAVGVSLMMQAPDNWKERLSGLTSVNWRKSNADWENICIVANSVVSNRQARLATQAYLKRRLGVDLTKAEHRALPEEAPQPA
ncbi:MAG: DNA sulfur modification protein DndB [Spirochaetaceae bacterium]|nr:DNA sulfur modification protein DndB [Spirochaetaceae bacterium]